MSGLIYAYDDASTCERQFYHDKENNPFLYISLVKIELNPKKWGRWRPGVFDLYNRPIDKELTLPKINYGKVYNYIGWGGHKVSEFVTNQNASKEYETYSNIIKMRLWNENDII